MKEYFENTFSGFKLSFYLRRSGYIHIALVALTLIGGKVAILESAKLREKNMELVQASVRVDMVAMPKYTLNELKNLSSGVEEAKKEEVTPAPEAAKVEVKEPPKEILKDAPKEEAKVEDKSPTFEEVNKLKRQNFLSKLKQIGNKKITSEGNQKADKGLYGEKSTNLKNLVMAGNKLNKGVQMYGDGNSGDMTAYQAYVARLPDLVRPHFKLPSFLKDKKLNCRVRVWVLLNGEVSRIEVYQSSGDSEYDQRAVEAVRTSSPFPKLAEEFGKRGQNGDIVLGFPL
ncbi:MAG: TonB family protein [Bacteriovorax sp.]|nr:TonB family protein [Bacteriovorax sp.]